MMTDDVDGAPASSPAPAPACSSVSFRRPGDPVFQPLEDEHGQEGKKKLADLLLTSMQMQHLLVFVGSGASLCCGYPGMWALYQEVKGLPNFELVRGRLKHPETNENIEDLLSRCDAHLLLREDRKVKEFRLRAIAKVLELCRDRAPLERLEHHKDFLRKLARRRARDSRLKLFTTNYDLCFEAAAGAVSMVPIDGFSFSQPRRFDPRFFEYDIVRRDGVSESSSFVPGVFHYYKIHGSVDWAVRDGKAEINPGVSADAAGIVYPARAKYQRTFEQPHLEIVAQYLAALRQPNTCLLVIGFGFADDHLTRPILSALETNPHFRMIVADPVAEKRLAQDTEGNWPQLASLSQRTDLTFINAKFDELVPLIPDLSALSPAQELARAIQKVARP